MLCATDGVEGVREGRAAAGHVTGFRAPMFVSPSLNWTVPMRWPGRRWLSDRHRLPVLAVAGTCRSVVVSTAGVKTSSARRCRLASRRRSMRTHAGVGDPRRRGLPDLVAHRVVKDRIADHEAAAQANPVGVALDRHTVRGGATPTRRSWPSRFVCPLCNRACLVRGRPSIR